jgi:hypothetical protein
MAGGNKPQILQTLLSLFPITAFAVRNIPVDVSDNLLATDRHGLHGTFPSIDSRREQSILPAYIYIYLASRFLLDIHDA